MWVTTTGGVIRIAPDGTSTTFFNVNGFPAGIATGSDGALWVTASHSVTRIDAADPDAAVQTEVGTDDSLSGITTGADGNLWAIAGKQLVKIPPANPAAASIYYLQDAGGVGRGIAAGQDGTLWIADTNGYLIRTSIEAPLSYTVEEGPGGPQDVVTGPNGQFGYTDPRGNFAQVGLINPGLAPQPFPVDEGEPWGITLGSDAAYWIALRETDELLRLTPDGTISTFPGLPSREGGAGPQQIAAGPGNTIWVTLSRDDSYIVKIAGLEPAVAPPVLPAAPETTLTRTPPARIGLHRGHRRAKVRFAFTATGTAPSFKCTLTRRRGEQRTGACTSPKKYELKPGKYKFAVAATADGHVDESPATAKFKVVEP
jgi:virginiamycin B lyase